VKARFSDMVGVVEWFELNNWVMLLPDVFRVCRAVDLSVIVMRIKSSEGAELRCLQGSTSTPSFC